MGFLTGRDGSISVFRISIVAALLGALFIVGGVILFTLEQAANRQPLEIAVPESAERRGVENRTPNNRRIYFETTDTPEQVAEFYNRLLSEFYNDPRDQRGCQRFNYEGAVPGSGRVPFEFKCMFTVDAQGIERWTEVLIQPGVRNDATGEDYTGTTRIEHEQYWEP